jgi:hypothetical protein
MSTPHCPKALGCASPSRRATTLRFVADAASRKAVVPGCGCTQTGLEASRAWGSAPSSDSSAFKCHRPRSLLKIYLGVPEDLPWRVQDFHFSLQGFRQLTFSSERPIPGARRLHDTQACWRRLALTMSDCFILPCRRCRQRPKPAKPEPNKGFWDTVQPRPYGQFLDDPPIHIRPDLPAARVQSKQTL